MTNDIPAQLGEMWFALDDQTYATAIGAELRRELATNHVLFPIGTTAVACRQDRDDVLYRLDDGRWAIVHLTWSGSQEQDPRWPKTEIYSTLEELRGQLDNDSEAVDLA